MASNSVQPVQPVQQMPQAAQPQHMPNEPQVREFLVDHIGYANPNDDRLEELAEMGVDAEMYDRSIELARQPLALHDRAHTDILDRVVNNIATLRGRLDAMLGGQAGLLIWFLGLYTMTRRWFELHAQVGHGTTRLTFSHYDTLNIDDVQPVNWLFVIRQWLDCIIHSYALGRRALECPELRRYMEETSYLLVGDEADQPDGTYQPDNLVAEAAASVSHMRIAFDRTNNLLDLCLNPNVQSVNTYLADVETGYRATPSGISIDLCLPLLAFRSVMNVYLPEVRAWDAMMHEDLPQIELPAQQWVPITTTLSDEEMAAAAPTACNVCQAWVNNETDTLVRLTCNSEGCQATFHGGDEGCLQEWFNKTQHVDPTCPLCRRPVERRFLDEE